MTNLNQSDYYLTARLSELCHEHSSSECRYCGFHAFFFFFPIELSIVCGFLRRHLSKQILWNEESTLLESNSLKEVSLVWGEISVKEEVGIRRLVLELAWHMRHCPWHGTWSHSSEVRRESKASMYLGLRMAFFFVCACEKVLFLCCKVKSSCILKGVSFQDESIPFYCLWFFLAMFQKSFNSVVCDSNGWVLYQPFNREMLV